MLCSVGAVSASAALPQRCLATMHCADAGAWGMVQPSRNGSELGSVYEARRAMSSSSMCMLGDDNGYAMCGIDPTTAPKQLWYHMTLWGSVMQESSKQYAPSLASPRRPLGFRFPAARPVESSRASPPHRPREDALAHPVDTSRSNLAAAWVCFRSGGFPTNPGLVWAAGGSCL
jgi:hypothetical protein